jgi:quinol monooxygenase YgiN/DNA invertase Pin-like site-specific DNA recombinase
LKTKAEPPRENRRLGYARVSTYGQTLDAQLEQLRAERCGRIYREKVTGAHNDRRELLKMLKHLAPSDVVTVTRIDRSTFDLFAIVKQIVVAKAQFRSLAEPWADTGTSLMLAVLGGLADVERDLIRTRTAEGRSRAQKRGQRMGRKPKLTEAQQAEARQRTGGGSHPRGTRAQLWRRQEHDFTALVLIEILLGGIPTLASAPSDRRSCRGNEPEGMFMSRLMIVVEFEVKPEHRSAFVELMKGHAQRSRAEDGCQQFDVLVPQEDQSRVFLVEAWRDQAALDVHIKLPAMARLREAWQPWLVSMKATRCIAD